MLKWATSCQNPTSHSCVVLVFLLSPSMPQGKILGFGIRTSWTPHSPSYQLNMVLTKWVAKIGVPSKQSMGSHHWFICLHRGYANVHRGYLNGGKRHMEQAGRVRRKGSHGAICLHTQHFVHMQDAGVSCGSIRYTEWSWRAVLPSKRAGLQANDRATEASREGI